MKESNFYTPESVKPLYPELAAVYQSAFASEPWREVSRCADRLQRCLNGLSAVAVGATCVVCSENPTEPAYVPTKVIKQFEAVGATRPVAWYAEQNERGVTLAALAWRAQPQQIAQEKYNTMPEMTAWMTATLPQEPIMWLDEVFADKAKRPQGNLRNFGQFVTGLATRLAVNTVAYRTIEPRMTQVPQRDFGQDATIYTRQTEVPDWRDFVVINVNREK